METLKNLIKSKEADKIIHLITDNPGILDDKDENGSSGFLIIAYSSIDEAFVKAKELKETFTFHEAVVAGELEMVEAHLSQGSQIINVHSQDGFTLLSLAAFFNQTEIAKLLLDKGANPDLQATNPSRVNALHAAVAKENYELCRIFIEHGANVNAVQMQNVTPLHSAVHRGDLALVKLLVENGADVRLKMDNGDTAVSIAEKDGHQEVEAYLQACLK